MFLSWEYLVITETIVYFISFGSLWAAAPVNSGDRENSWWDLQNWFFSDFWVFLCLFVSFIVDGIISLIVIWQINVSTSRPKGLVCFLITHERHLLCENTFTPIPKALPSTTFLNSGRGRKNPGNLSIIQYQHRSFQFARSATMQCMKCTSIFLSPYIQTHLVDSIKFSK